MKRDSMTHDLYFCVLRISSRVKQKCRRARLHFSYDEKIKQNNKKKLVMKNNLHSNCLHPHKFIPFESRVVHLLASSPLILFVSSSYKTPGSIFRRIIWSNRVQLSRSAIENDDACIFYDSCSELQKKIANQLRQSQLKISEINKVGVFWRGWYFN